MGGGTIPHPGEVSLSHNGLLFLDELVELDHHTLEILRQPLEDHQVTITRASWTVSYPYSFMLIGAMNPCPCGYFGHPRRKCTCIDRQVRQYLNRISGPLLDRFDLHIEVELVSFDDLSATKNPKIPPQSASVSRRRVKFSTNAFGTPASSATPRFRQESCRHTARWTTAQAYCFGQCSTS